MEGSGTGIGRLDCYEDMFKEITRKLYGEDPDHRTSSVQNEFEASVSYKNDEDTGNTDSSDDGHWTYEEEPLKGTDGSRIAAYHAGKAMWRCDECGDVTGGGPREAAEHFMELHSSRFLTDGRNRHHSPRKDYLQADLKIEDVVLYLDRLRERAERAAPPSRRTQETQTVPAALLPVTSSFLLQELPSATAPQHLQQTTTVATSPTASTGEKRYKCPYCTYGTDRRDLYTRHENIHREDKPFFCYICSKPFNRADHVKKHFLRMHREHTYELSRIRRPAGTTAPRPLPQDSVATPAVATVTTNNQQQQQQQHISYQSAFTSNKGYQLQPNATSTGASTLGIYQAATMPAPGIMQPDANNCNTNRRGPSGGCNSKSHLKGGSKSAQERRYTCLYCPWSGVDNWCLKRHMNTHTKPFECGLCEYKAARAERLATHVLKVHNKRQCSRCSFLGDDMAQLQMHQLHVHRISSASAPSTSTTQTVQPPSLGNRHQQPLHPVGGGRPPPGPPVFPAPTPTIAPATPVIPPSTILGHEMVKSPATAATMAYPTEEEKRSHRRVGGIHGDDSNDDDDDVVRSNGNREERSRDFGACRVCDFKSDRDLDDPELCSSGHSNGSSSIGATDTSNSDFIRSYQLPLVPNGVADDGKPLPGSSRDQRRDRRKKQYREAGDWESLPDLSQGSQQSGADDLSLDHGHDEPDGISQYLTSNFITLNSFREQRQDEKENQQRPCRDPKRSRKQSQPRQVICHREESRERKRYAITVFGLQNAKETIKRKIKSSGKIKLLFKQESSERNVTERKLARQRMLKCHMCPKYAPARGMSRRPYHSRASLTLHTLWRHKRRSWSAKNPASRNILPSTVSSITLKATFFTRPNYSYHR